MLFICVFLCHKTLIIVELIFMDGMFLTYGLFMGMGRPLEVYPTLISYALKFIILTSV
jgi:hypothetical protein